MVVVTLIIAHVLLATIVSAHALLSKRDARATIAWLGVAWLSPMIGSIGYSLFGVNRIARRALRLRSSNPSVYAGHESDFETGTMNDQPASRIRKVGDAVSRQPILGGNQVQIYQNGDEAYPEMISAIKKAQKTIALCTYIFRLDENGMEFISALRDAKSRGVEVKVLVDGFGGGIFRSAATSKLNEFGIDAHRFLPSLAPWRMPYLNLRNHKKLLIIDGKIGFVGGMNLGNENLLHRKSRYGVRDTHFCFTGPIVVQLLESFTEDWYFTTNAKLTHSDWWPNLNNKGEVEGRAVISGPDHDLGSIEKLLTAAINGAKYHIRIVTPYFLPDERIGFLLDMAVLRGVSVELVIPQYTDNLLFDWAMESQLSFMDTDRIECWRSMPPFDHSKLVTIDGEWCAIGSPNWDIRSMRLNFEILVECYDPETVMKIDRIIDEKIEQSIPHRDLETNWGNQFYRLRNAAARLLMPYL
ncbi:MAG: phospholipase D-like domain-containing protein [Pseudomonadota bacterium]